MKSHTKQLRDICIVLGVIGVAFLAVFVRIFPRSSFDVGASQHIQGASDDLLTVLMYFISAFGDMPMAVLAVFAAALFFFLTEHRREAVFACGTFLADLFNFLLKYLFHRARPDASDVTILQHLTTHSFPSGHVVHYVAFFGFLIASMFYLRRVPMSGRISVICISFFLIFTVGISRIYLGAHFATDVMGGYLVGGLFLLVYLPFYFREHKENI